MTVCIKKLKELPLLSTSARDILKIIHDDADIVDLSLPYIVIDQPHIIDSIVEKASTQVKTYREMQRAELNCYVFI
jgi:hypothetical protein